MSTWWDAPNLAADLRFGLAAKHLPRTRDWGAFVALVLLAACGCNTSALYPVEGKVVDAQGNPIPGIHESNYVMFSQTGGGLTSSMGEIAADGSFRMFTETPGDGVPAGEYHVHLPRKHLDPEHTAPQVIDGRFESLENSGWTKTVEAKRNSFVLEVTPPRRKGR